MNSIFVRSKKTGNTAMPLADILFLIAAGLSLLGLVAHELVGAPRVLRPLKDAGLPPQVVGLHHFSWHVGSVAVAGMIVLYLLAVWHPAGAIFAIIASAISAGIAAFGIGLALFVNPALWRTPAPYPWSLIAIIGGLGAVFAQTPA